MLIDRLEKLGFRTNIGKVKALGITVGIGGAMLISFYRGLELKFWSINIHLPKMNNSQQKHDGSNNYILGFVCASGSCISYALWLIIQVQLDFYFLN